MPSLRRVIWGLPNIASTIQRSVPETRWLIKQKRLRVRKHGHRTFSALEDELLEDCSGGPLDKVEEDNAA
jgi:hypothetical protein